MRVRSAIVLSKHLGTAIDHKGLKKQIPISLAQPRLVPQRAGMIRAAALLGAERRESEGDDEGHEEDDAALGHGGA